MASKIIHPPDARLPRGAKGGGGGEASGWGRARGGQNEGDEEERNYDKGC